MHAFDGQTDGQTDGRTDGILIARPRLHSMQRGKNGRSGLEDIRTSFTALRALHATQSSYEKAVCLSVRLSNA